MVPLVPKNLPDLSSVRVWIGAGSEDPIIATSETQRLVELLRSASADVTLRFFNAAHGLTNSEVETARQWLKDLSP
jgi:phospholipase/carboxylesterase